MSKLFSFFKSLENSCTGIFFFGEESTSYFFFENFRTGNFSERNSCVFGEGFISLYIIDDRPKKNFPLRDLLLGKESYFFLKNLLQEFSERNYKVIFFRSKSLSEISERKYKVIFFSSKSLSEISERN